MIPTLSRHQHLLIGGVLYSFAPGVGPSLGTATAHDLTDGAVRWTSPLGVDGRDRWGELSIRVVGDRILFSADDATAALDAATGRRLWSLRERIVPVGPGRVGLGRQSVLLAEAAPAGSAEMYGVAAPTGQRVRGVDLDTGAELWSASPVGSAEPARRADGAPALLVRTLAGGVEVWDAGTGAVLGRWAGEQSPPPAIIVPGGTRFFAADGSTLTGYVVDGLAPAWRVPLPRVVSENGIEPCGGYLCLATRAGLTWFDPATGSAVRTGSVGAGLSESGGHLIIRGTRSGPSRTVDPRDGRTLIDLSRWSQPVRSDDGSPVVARITSGPQRLWFGVLDPGATAVRVVGRVPYPSFGCWSSVSHVACQTAADQLRVWRYR